jgi:O-antigen/teichoic acid export membrane protein
MLFFGALLGAHSGALAGFEAFQPLARANVIASLASLPIVIGGVYAWGLDGAVLGLVLATAVNGFLVWRALRLTARERSAPIRLRGSLAEMRTIWGFGLPALLAGALVAPVNWVCAAMLVNRPDGYAEMGIYNAANQWRLALLHLPAVLGQVVTPMLAERIGARDTDSSRGLLFLAIKINAALTLPALALISLVPSFVLGLYGSEFQGGSATLIVAVGVGALMAIQSPVGNVIVAMGRMWTAFFMNLGWGVATVLLTWAALPLGAFGLALAQLGGYLVHSIWTFGFAYRVMPRKGSAAPVERAPVT